MKNLTALLCWGALACSPGPTGVVVNQSVTVVVNAGPERGGPPAGIDLADPRIAAAERELVHLLGGSLVFELDPALQPSFDRALQPAIVAGLEQTVTQLQYLSERHPDAFAFTKAHLKTIRWSYAPSENPPDPALDTASGVLTIGVPSSRGVLIADGDIVGAVLGALERHDVDRYEGMPAERVPAGEERDYFDYQSHYHRPAENPNAPKLSSDERDLIRLGNILALYPRIKDPALQKDARKWLLSAGSRLRRVYADKQADDRTRRRASELRPAWIRWLNQNQAALDANERRDMAELLFERSYFPTESFRSGFDSLAFAQPTLTAWLARGGRAENENAPDRAETLIVCPYTWDRDVNRISAPGHCNAALYLDLFTAPGGPAKLAALVVKSKSDPLTQTALLHVMTHRGVPAMLELFAQFANDDAAARASLSALAAFDGWGAQHSPREDEVALDPQPLFDRIPTWWKSYPGRRPQTLFLLTQLANRYEGIIAWPKLPTYLGSRISAEELSGFLDQSPRAIWFLQNLAGGLSDGWRKSAVLIPKLDSWLTHRSRQSSDGPEPYYLTERVVELLCDAGTKSDLIELQKFLKKRLESFPSEQRDLGSFAEKSLSELCPKVRDEKPKQPVLFGD